MAYFTFPSDTFSNINLNAPGSNYATTYNHDKTKLIRDMIRQIIFDAAPQEYMDLAILGMAKPRVEKSDEFIYLEMQYQRKSVQTPTLTANIAAAGSYTVPVVSTEDVGLDTILVYTSNNQKATVIAIDATASTVTLKAMTGATLPALSSGSTYVFPNHSSVDFDGTSTITTNYRLNNLIERYNFVQMYAKATTFGRMELYKYENAGTTDYLMNNRQQMMNMYRMDISNSYWNGDRGEVTSSTGKKGKTMGGIYPAMIQAGSYEVTTTTGSLVAAFKDAVFSTQFGKSGYTRFLYGTPRLLDTLSDAFKGQFIRYTPESSSVYLELDAIDLRTSRIVLVPMQRWERKSNSFPDFWENQLILLDQSNIRPVICWGERIGRVPNRESAPNLNNYEIEYIEGTMSQEFNNPLGSAIIKVS